MSNFNLIVKTQSVFVFLTFIYGILIVRHKAMKFYYRGGIVLILLCVVNTFAQAQQSFMLDYTIASGDSEELLHPSDICAGRDYMFVGEYPYDQNGENFLSNSGRVSVFKLHEDGLQACPADL